MLVYIDIRTLKYYVWHELIEVHWCKVILVTDIYLTYTQQCQSCAEWVYQMWVLCRSRTYGNVWTWSLLCINLFYHLHTVQYPSCLAAEYWRERERGGGGIFIGIKRKNAKKVSYPCFSMYNMIFFFQSPCCKLRIMDKILF